MPRSSAFGKHNPCHRRATTDAERAAKTCSRATEYRETVQRKEGGYDQGEVVQTRHNGVGAGIVSPLVAEGRGLVRVDCDLPPVPSRDLYLVYHRALRDVPRIAVLRKWLVQTAAEFLAGQKPT